mmetsp:Transcript_43367/g.123657  ORF Transcript_43367/g.123657 Transcript_43367/m.123657 type:complete len:222 (-) Transcript_43367:817-1482(-)
MWCLAAVAEQVPYPVNELGLDVGWPLRILRGGGVSQAAVQELVLITVDQIESVVWEVPPGRQLLVHSMVVLLLRHRRADRVAAEGCQCLRKPNLDKVRFTVEVSEGGSAVPLHGMRPHMREAQVAKHTAAAHGPVHEHASVAHVPGCRQICLCRRPLAERIGNTHKGVRKNSNMRPPALQRVQDVRRPPLQCVGSCSEAHHQQRGQLTKLAVHPVKHGLGV